MGRILTAIMLGGLAAGALDILYAFIVYGPLAPQLGMVASLSPAEVLQSVYGGWVGHEAAAAGGVHAAVLGACTHFGIALVMAAIFVLAATRWGMLTEHPILWGFLYGFVLFLVMNYIGVPFSAAATGEFATLGDAGARIQAGVARTLEFRRPLLLAGTILTHTVLVGVPIALVAKRYA